MKTHSFICLFFVATLLSGCATTQPKTRIDRIPEHNGVRQSNLSNTEGFKQAIATKLKGLAEKDLQQVSSFIDSLWEIKGTGKQLVVAVIEEKVEETQKFPAEIAAIMSRHPKLNALPRNPSTLFILERKTTGVRNIFLRVPASAMGAQDTLALWAPKEEDWVKYVDARANQMTGKSVTQQFLTLFWAGNEKFNPELTQSLEAQGFNWGRMVHPGKTKQSAMLIPIATAIVKK